MLFMSLSDSGVGAGAEGPAENILHTSSAGQQTLVWWFVVFFVFLTFQTDCLYVLNTDKRASDMQPNAGTALLLPLLVNYLLLQPDSLSFPSHRSRPAQQQQCRGENGLSREIEDVNF